MLWLLSSLAFALSCGDPFTAEEFTELVDRAEAALDNDDVMGHGQTWIRMKESLPCMEEPLPTEQWARYLIGYAIIRHATGEEWRAPVITALTIHPEVPRDYGHDDIRLFPQPPEEPLRGLPLAPDESFLLDGRPIELAPPRLEGPHVLQLEGEPFKTRLVIDDDFPPDWLAPPETFAPAPRPEPEEVAEDTEPDQPKRDKPVREKKEKPERAPRAAADRKRSPVLPIAGGTLAALGTTAALASYFGATGDDAEFDSPREWNRATLVNAVGWTAAGVGAGLVTVHLVGGATVNVGPGQVRFHARF